MKKAYYIDTYSTVFLHEMFNASSLLMFSAMYDHIEYRASRSSYEHVIQLLGSLPNNVTFAPLPIVNIFVGWEKAKQFIKRWQAIVINTMYVLRIPAGCDIIFNYDTLPAILSINIAARFTKNRILQICHGELTELKTGRSRHYLSRCALIFLRKSNHVADNFFFAVLGESIFRNVQSLVSEQVKSRLLYFDHTAIVSKQKDKNKTKTDKLVLGTIGRIHGTKGIDAFVKLAQSLKTFPNVELRCLGGINLTATEVKDLGLVVISQQSLSREELRKQIQQLDYALFLYQPEVYKYTASGSVFDTIAYNTPIISLQNDYFESLFSLYGEFGYLEKDVDSMAKRIKWLAEHPNNIVTWNIEEIQKRINPVLAAEQFKNQWMPD